MQSDYFQKITYRLLMIILEHSSHAFYCLYDVILKRMELFYKER